MNKKIETKDNNKSMVYNLFKCLFQKHKLIECEIQGDRFRCCERCKHTQHMFLFGWGKIKRTEAIQDYINNNAQKGDGENL